MSNRIDGKKIPHVDITNIAPVSLAKVEFPCPFSKDERECNGNITCEYCVCRDYDTDNVD